MKPWEILPPVGVASFGLILSLLSLSSLLSLLSLSTLSLLSLSPLSPLSLPPSLSCYIYIYIHWVGLDHGEISDDITSQTLDSEQYKTVDSGPSKLVPDIKVFTPRDPHSREVLARTTTFSSRLEIPPPPTHQTHPLTHSPTTNQLATQKNRWGYVNQSPRLRIPPVTLHACPSMWSPRPRCTPPHRRRPSPMSAASNIVTISTTGVGLDH